MKKLTALVAAAVMTIGMAACGSDNEKSDTSSKAETSAVTTTAESKATESEDHSSSKEESSVTEDSSAPEESSTAESKAEASESKADVPDSSAAESAPDESKLPELTPPSKEVTEDEIAIVSGTGYTMEFPLARWVDVTDQAENFSSEESTTSLDFVFGWLKDGMSSCTVAVTAQPVNTDSFPREQLRDMLIDGSSSIVGQTLVSADIVTVGDNDWVRCEYDFDPEVYGVSAKSIQYHSYKGKIQLTISFSVAEGSYDLIEEDMNAVLSSAVLWQGQ